MKKRQATQHASPLVNVVFTLGLNTGEPNVLRSYYIWCNNLISIRVYHKTPLSDSVLHRVDAQIAATVWRLTHRSWSLITGTVFFYWSRVFSAPQ